AGEGGGMYARDVASIMFSDMQLLGNQAALNGGGLHLSHSMANIMHSEVSWNMAVTGGGIHSATDVQMTINGSRVGGNVAKSGGGIDSTDSGAELLLYGSLIAANEAQGGNGGGISIAGPLEAEDSEISGSIAYIDGGGIYAEALVVLRGCHILWNVAHSNGAGIRSNTDTFLEDSRVCENVCWGLGGGVYHRTNKLQVHAASQVCRNTAEYGGGVYAWTAASILLEEGSLVEENKAKQTGGGMWLSAGCELEVRSSSGVVNNSAEKEGGGVAMQEGDATMRVTNQSRLEGNRAELYSGGGISTALGNRVWLESSELSFNFAGTYGGGMLLYQAVAEAVSMRIIGNAATYAGGGMQIMKGSQIWFWGTLMQPVVIANNTAVEQGGGVGVFSVSEAWFGFTDDTSSGSVWAPSTNLSACAGSVLGQLDLTKDHAVVLSHNEAETGAVLYGEDSSVITLQDGHIYGNTAHRDEASDAPDVTVGGILNVQASTFNMLDSVLEGNSGSGCLIGQNALVAIQGSVFMNHTSVSHGGGIRTMRGSDTSLTDSAFVANSVQGQGSAVHAHGALEVSQCSFEGGRAEHGGALAGKLYENQRMALTLCALCRNVAAENGAALYLTLAASLNGSALLQLTDLELRDNQASSGIFFWEPADRFATNRSTPPSCANCTFTGNNPGYASESGWASATVAIEVSAQHPEEAGGYNIDEPLVVELKDMFGSLVSSDNSTQVSLATGCSKRGMSKDIVSTGSAIFDLLAFGGLPGSECEVVFTAMVSDVELSVTTIVPLRLCHVGEHYDDSASQCVPCSPGSLSFSNDTTPCYDCIGDSGIECKGYADYHIRNGYWLAPAASACDTAACLVSRLYSCEIQDACSTDGSQRNGTLQTILVACALVAVFNSALIFILQRANMADVRQVTAVGRETLESSGDVQEVYDEIVAQANITRIVGLLLGYLQVVGAMGSIFSSGDLPISFARFTSFMSFDLNLFSTALNVECTNHFLGLSSSMTGFELSFLMAMLAPWILVVLDMCVFALYMEWHKRRNAYCEVTHLRKPSLEVLTYLHQDLIFRSSRTPSSAWPGCLVGL
ncbi:hypothetical protein CYMTET_26795, partial [Cymbomonas tetramitiformis]